MIIVTLTTLKRYLERKIKVILLLLLSFVFTLLGIATSFSGRLIVYMTNWQAQYTHIFVIPAEILILFGVLAMFYFSDIIFDFAYSRELISIASVCTGVTIGMLIYNGIFYPIYAYGTQPAKIYFIASVSNAITIGGMYLTIFFFGMHRSRTEKSIIKKRSIELISSYGVLAFMALILFSIDALISYNFNDYLPTYYFGWILVLLAIIGAYLGYFLPTWFKRIIRLN
ncbi:MAG: hypothetical protein ACTSYD_10055, partial [Candidatus Heimdallarchaeaceae archaeon]